LAERTEVIEAVVENPRFRHAVREANRQRGKKLEERAGEMPQLPTRSRDTCAATGQPPGTLGLAGVALLPKWFCSQVPTADGQDFGQRLARVMVDVHENGRHLVVTPSAG